MDLSIQESKKVSKAYKIYVLDKYQLIFDLDIKHEVYECKWYYGIIFYIGEGKWDVIHNIYMGNRLLISEHPYWLRDIPFHEGTFKFLPEQIQVLNLPI